MGAAPIELGALVIVAALLAKSGILGDALPKAPPTTTPDTDVYGITPAGLTQLEWEKFNPGGSYADYRDYLVGQ